MEILEVGTLARGNLLGREGRKTWRVVEDIWGFTEEVREEGILVVKEEVFGDMGFGRRKVEEEMGVQGT